MRYLKRFNENNTKEDLQDFCETHLAYLLDDGYELFVGDNRGEKTISITIPSDVSTEEDPDAGDFRWGDVKDHFITFLTHLNNKYKIIPFHDDLPNLEPTDIIQFFTNNHTWKYYSVQEVLDDKPSELNCYLYEITVKVEL